MNLGLFRGAVAIGLGFLVMACSPISGDDPISRRLTWFGYVSGERFERACTATSRERYRLVFNAEYTVQVRTYDIVADELGALVQGRVFRGGFLSDQAFPSLTGGLIGKEAALRIDEAELAEFRRAVAASQPFHGDAPVHLRSDSFYWVLLSCVDGVFEARGFTGPASVLERLPIRRFLVSRDPTGVPIRVQRTVPADHVTNYGLAYSPMESESEDRARGAGDGLLFQMRYENRRIRFFGS